MKKIKWLLLIFGTCIILVILYFLVNQNEITVQGTLIATDGSSKENIQVTVCKAKGDSFSIDVGKEGVLLNPFSETDKNGKFKIKFKRTYIGDNNQFTLIANGNILKVEKNNSSIVFTVDKHTKLIDLDKICGSIIIHSTF